MISGDTFSRYMGVDNIEGEHHTLVLSRSSPRLYVQLLKLLHPDPVPDVNIPTLRSVGFNPICFAVEDLEAQLMILPN
ncbi:Uncharacterised protein [Halioglobus japonicus]|nr:Uncharacterised protein [Halioglobus japonicus]